MSKTSQQQFRGTMNIFYSICRLTWASFTAYVGRFTEFSEKYDAAYGQAALAAVEAAVKLPDDSVRRSNSKSKRKKLIGAARVCGNQWQTLARYIEKAFPPDQVEAMLLAAGSDLYRSAANENWSDLSVLLTRASEFITEYTTTLLKNGKGMPAGFPAQFAAAATTCNTLINEYQGNKQNGDKIISAKAEANNAVYATLMDMLKDAKTIFVNEPGIRKHFTYSAVEKMVRRGQATGLRISVKESGTLLPVTTTTFLFQPGNVTAYVDAKGVVAVKLPQGVYSYVATTPGYATIYGDNINTTTGVMHRLELLLNKEIAAA